MRAQPKRHAKGGRINGADLHLQPEHCKVRRQGLTGDPQAAGTPFSGARQWPDHGRVELVAARLSGSAAKGSMFRAASS